MKKVIVIVLMLVYGVSSMGMTLNLHYCCGKFSAINFSAALKNNYPAGNSITTKGCCDTKQIELTIKSDYQKDTEIKTGIKQLQVEKLLPVYFTAATPLLQGGVFAFADSSPPFSASVPLNILFCIYRI